MTDRTIRLASRPSPLAIRQTELVADRISKLMPEWSAATVEVQSEGDESAERPVAELGDKAVFVTRVEAALLDGRADAAVHSLKDMPVDTPEGLEIVAFLPREDPRDVLVSAGGERLAQLPAAAKVGTSSSRRIAQLRTVRPDLAYAEIRGNVGTRLEKLKRGEFDAVLLAAAGLARMGLENEITEYLDPGLCLPAPGQGIIAVECVFGSDFASMLLKIGDDRARLAGSVERAIAAQVGADCRSAFGALASVHDATISVMAVIERESGSLKRIADERPIADPGELVLRVARNLTAA